MQSIRSNISFPNGIFAVHIADFIPIYAFRAISLTQTRLGLIGIAQKRPPFSYCQLIQTEKVGHWIRVDSSQTWGRLEYSFTTYGSILLLSSLIGIINRLSQNNVSFNLRLLAQVQKWNLLEVDIFQKIVGWNITYDCVYFSDLQRLADSFLTTYILFPLRAFC